MKYIAGLFAIIGVFPETSAQGVINVTADVSCPQKVVTLTCVTENVPFTTLCWTHDNRINLDQPPVGHIFGREDVYPLQVDVSSVMGILNFTIVNASVESGDSDITAELIIDLDVLYIELGYRSLQCGSPVMDANFDFATQLGIEAPLGFKINRLDLFYTATSSSVLEKLLMETGRPVSANSHLPPPLLEMKDNECITSVQAYSSTTCSYTNETYLNTSIAGTVVRTIVVNDSTCMDDVCSVELTDVVDGTGDVDLSVVAGNKFETTAATPSNIQFPLSTGSNFDPTLMHTNDFQFSEECDVPLNIVICEVSYGTSSFYQNSEPVPIPFNEERVIRELEANTTYYVEVVYHTRSMEVDIFYHFRTNFTTGDSTTTRTTLYGALIAVTAVVSLIVVGVLIAVIMSILLLKRKNTRKECISTTSNDAYGLTSPISMATNEAYGTRKQVKEIAQEPEECTYEQVN